MAARHRTSRGPGKRTKIRRLERQLPDLGENPGLAEGPTILVGPSRGNAAIGIRMSGAPNWADHRTIAENSTMPWMIDC